MQEITIQDFFRQPEMSFIIISGKKAIDASGPYWSMLVDVYAFVNMPDLDILRGVSRWSTEADYHVVDTPNSYEISSRDIVDVMLEPAMTDCWPEAFVDYRSVHAENTDLVELSRCWSCGSLWRRHASDCRKVLFPKLR